MVTQFLDVSGWQHDQVTVGLEHTERHIFVLARVSFSVLWCCGVALETYLLVALVDELLANSIVHHTVGKVRQ